MIKRICPKCLTPWHSSSTKDEVWICQKCDAEIPKSEEREAEHVTMKNNVLWKYDSELVIAYFCPRCKVFICSGHGPYNKCGHELDWNNKVEYKGKVRWD